MSLINPRSRYVRPLGKIVFESPAKSGDCLTKGKEQVGFEMSSILPVTANVFSDELTINNEVGNVKSVAGTKNKAKTSDLTGEETATPKRKKLGVFALPK